MGRSKFPGKPSKLGNRKRVSVLQGNQNSKSDAINDRKDDGNGDGDKSGKDKSEKYDKDDRISSRNNKNGTLGITSSSSKNNSGSNGGGNCVANDALQTTSVHSAIEKPPSDEPPDGGGSQNGGISTRAKNYLSTGTHSSPVSGNKREKPTSKKKTVTFKNILETSDDAYIVKKVYNPDVKTPLIPIIKKECLSPSLRLARNDCIVRPSRLTEILKNNANNIDKLNFLKFRTNPSSRSSATSAEQDGQINATSLVDSHHDHNQFDLAGKAATDSNDSTSEKNSASSSSGVGDKRFVLPKRSAHSCRVIKPNKRFLDDSEIFSKMTNQKKSILSSLAGKNIDGKFIRKVTASTDERSATDKVFEDVTEGMSFSTSTSSSLSQFDYKSSSKCDGDEQNPEDDGDDDNLSEVSHMGTDDTSLSDSTENEEADAENKSHYRQSFNEKMETHSSTLTSTNKFVLRKPRLQFDSTPVAIEPQNALSLKASPFSLNLKPSGLSSATSTAFNLCAVCGSSINCKVLQKSRKYGIFACEACRKFISKITKKAVASSTNGSAAKSTILLECNKGDGTCIISPPIKFNLKSSKKAYKERCQACWLQKCLKHFNLPSGHKQRLSLILQRSSHAKEASSTETESSKSGCDLFGKKDSNERNLFNISSTKKVINWNANIGPLEGLFDAKISTSTLDATAISKSSISLSNPLTENNTKFGGLPLIKPAVLEKPVFMVSNTVEKSCTVVSAATDKAITVVEREEEKPVTNVITANKKEIKEVEAPSVESLKPKLRRKDKDDKDKEITQQPSTAPAAVEPPKRQRIELKGPRVKHVCRSASIVLGQPIATFPSDSANGLESMDTPPRPESPNNTEIELSDVAMGENCACTQHSEQRHKCDITDLGLSPPATPTENRAADDCINNDSKDEVDCPVGMLTASSKEVVKSDDIAKTTTAIQKKSSRSVFADPVPRNINAFSKKFAKSLMEKSLQQTKTPVMISIDFWENYDPAEVSQTGFGLIVTESLPMKALCFLCGSTGLDPLIFCASCCEPYHQYCVQDEYNLKHSSLDDTMLSLLDTSINPIDNMNAITNRLNWLCPRCTVCYTCNMSSGSKVKCQKCQKNYHTTCLGTSKRLSGSDRPLICVNCLKCKSCTTTKVSKFIGNLPMCSQCFKLRKKGNFCPICQKCYEENDFDLKMMECGDCQKWVHAKCEGLSDEQYNLLSALPESIEFICKKCSRTNDEAKEKANEWREAVAVEFKSGLLSVVKLLSKSRQACALLKLSPRKKTGGNCNCHANGNVAKSLHFGRITDTENVSEIDSSQNSEDVDIYEFKESRATPPSSSSSASSHTKCYCPQRNKMFVTNTPSLVDVKLRANAGDYTSLAEFNYDMNNVIMAANCDELIIAYKEILSEQFPWFQNETKACTDALEEDMFDSCAYSQNADDIERGDQQVPVIDLPDNIDTCLYSTNIADDYRICMFCKKIGEREPSQESRLLYCGHNTWVHTNCAMWSAEVFEEIDGSLQNVHGAIARGRMIKCTVCGNRGATIGCNKKSCGEHYHYSCAKDINCAFMTDKTVYCPEHVGEASSKKCSEERNFEVLRPVYVELDRKRKKLTEPSKVRFFIGSLEIKHLGKIIPKFSDTNDVIVPIDFACTRLYWSTKEPWKIVEYTVRTVVENNTSLLPNDYGRNFTVDHSNSVNMVHLGLTQIAKWHHSLASGEADMLDCYYRPNNTFKHILEAVGVQNNSDDGTEEEPQNNADLLPPEIKDAIFEDLPHEILDGISMLDIFPKLMIYEDMIAIDQKTDGYLMSEHSKDNTTGTGSDDDVGMKDFDQSNSWSMTTNNGINHVEDAMLSARNVEKRSKSEVFSRGIGLGGCLSQQRSSSLTWSCKLDNSAVKRRKMSQSVVISIGNKKYDFPSSRRQSQCEENNKTKAFTWSAAKRFNSELTETITSSKEDKLKIMQLDGMHDILPEKQNEMVGIDGPVKCDRCHCTYRALDSFQRHLATCEPFSTSESEESETTSRSPDIQSPPIQNIFVDMNKIQQVQQPLSFIQNSGGLFSNANGIPIGTLGGSSVIPISNGTTLQNMQIQNGNMAIAQFNKGMQNIFLNQQQAIAVSQQQQIFPTASLHDFNTIDTSANTQAITFTSSEIQRHQQQPQVFTTATAVSNQHVFASSQHQGLKTTSQVSKLNKVTKIQQSSKVKSKTITTTKQPVQIKKKSEQQQQTNQTQTMQIMSHQNLIPQQSQAPIIIQQRSNPNQPIILQQINGNTTGSTGSTSQNIIQYVTDNGQNQMQYVTLPSQDFKTSQTPFLTAANPIMQGAFLQTDASGNLVLSQAPAGLQMLSASPLQLAQSAAQPQVIGTFIQPQTLQLGGAVVSADQMMLGTAPTLEMISNQPTMILASQPMYYGLETIVQNTVMQSQQFVSGAMPGMLSQNASFSATTTQVFQASKIEPMMDIPTGYVVLNNLDGTSTIVQQPTTQNNMLATSAMQPPAAVPQINQSQALPTNQPFTQHLNTQAIQPIYNLQQTRPQPQQQPQQQQLESPVFKNQYQSQITQPAQTQVQVQQSNNILTQATSVALPQKLTAKSAPIVATKIQPQLMNKIAPNSIAQQQHQQSKQMSKSIQPLKAAKTVTIAPALKMATPGVKKVTKPIIATTAISMPTGVANQVRPKTTSMDPIPHPNLQRKTNMIRPLSKMNSVTIKSKFVNKSPTIAKQTTKSYAASINSVSTLPTMIAPKTQLKLQENNEIILTSQPGENNSNFEITRNFDSVENQVFITSTSDTSPQENVISISHAPSVQLNATALDISECVKKTAALTDISISTLSSSNKPQTVYGQQHTFQQLQQQLQQHQQIQQCVFNVPPKSQSQTYQNSTANTTSSIQLPSSPFVVSPFGNVLNTNVPTNIVNPIQQNQNNSVVSRPTNRVLPMQSVQQKHQLTVTKLSTDIVKTSAVEEGKKPKTTENQSDFQKAATSAAISSSIGFSDEEKLSNDIQEQQNIETNIIANQIEEILTQKHNEEKDFHSNNDSNNLKMISDTSMTKMDSISPDFIIQTESKSETDMIPMTADDHRHPTAEEVKENISEILDNFEREDCQSQMQIIRPQFHENTPVPDEEQQKCNPVEENDVDDILMEQKENVDPVAEEKHSEHKLDTLKTSSERFSNQNSTGPRLLYEIQSEDGFTYKSTSVTDVWEKVFEAVQVARKAHGLSPLPDGPLADMAGVQMLGLKTNAIRYLIEQLPGVERCNKYTPKYHKRPNVTMAGSSGYSSDQEELKENSFGAARCEPFESRSGYDMFSWLASRHRKQPTQVFIQPSDNEIMLRRGTGSNLPMAMKYRTLKETYKDYVGVFRSHIHGRGLYCTKDIEAGEMVIEYAGELIRSTLTDKRERYYDSKGIGCYMFKIDDNLVVDATMRGNAARFINHACEPNCYSKVVDILGHKHIIIFSLRRIVVGEELTYDYKFPFEDIKIPCSCGSKKCRKYLN